MRKKTIGIGIRAGVIAGLLVIGGTTRAEAQTLVGPLSYTSEASIPAGFYSSGAAFSLENFEDCSLDFGITSSGGMPISNVTGEGCTGFPGIIDSVDGDDGVIDGSGSDGRSYFSPSGSAGITFFFPMSVPAAAVVWTDGGGLTTFEAFGPGMVSLGTIGPVALADGTVTGGTAEDGFFGVQHAAGIVAVRLSNSGGGIEVDHVQYEGAFAAAPSTTAIGAAILLVASVAIVWWTRFRMSSQAP